MTNDHLPSTNSLFAPSTSTKSEKTCRQNRPKRKNYCFNPFEIVIHCSDKNLRKTVIVTLISVLSKTKKVGFVQRLNAIDNTNKESIKYDVNAAVSLILTDCGLSIRTNTLDFSNSPESILQCELVIVEDQAAYDIPAIVFAQDLSLDKKLAQKFRYPVVACFDTQTSLPAYHDDSIPYYSSDNIVGIAKLIENYLIEKSASVPLNGLVLIGGKSTRMQKDKASLNYHGKSQVEFCVELLSTRCDKIFVSSREDQRLEKCPTDVSQLRDQFVDIGPLGGILTALINYPEVAWLVLACDMPFLNDGTLSYLIKNRNSQKMATAFLSVSDGLPEPLCAIYEPKSIHRLMHFLSMGYKCPRKILMNSCIERLTQEDSPALSNVNYPEEYQVALEVINRGTSKH